MNNDPIGRKRDELKKQLDEIRDKQALHKQARSSTFEKIKVLNDAMNKKVLKSAFALSFCNMDFSPHQVYIYICRSVMSKLARIRCSSGRSRTLIFISSKLWCFVTV